MIFYARARLHCPFLTFHGSFFSRSSGRVDVRSCSSLLKNATVLIIRHTEKPEITKNLSPAGVRCAQWYVAFFRSLIVNSHLVTLDHLFAAQESKHSGRCHEALLPLSNALHLKINSIFDLSENQELAKCGALTVAKPCSSAGIMGQFLIS